MRLTPLDIRKQEFKKGMRGLDTDEVYAFLATVADEYEAVLNDNKALRERVVELDDKVQEYRTMEKTLRDTLLTAERLTAEAKENARREGDLMIKQAQIEAEKAVRDIKTNAMNLRKEILNLKRQRDSYVARMKMIVESHFKFIETAENDFVDEERRVLGDIEQWADSDVTAEPGGSRSARPAGSGPSSQRPSPRTAPADPTRSEAQKPLSPPPPQTPRPQAPSESPRAEAQPEPVNRSSILTIESPDDFSAEKTQPLDPVPEPPENRAAPPNDNVESYGAHRPAEPPPQAPPSYSPDVVDDRIDSYRSPDHADEPNVSVPPQADGIRPNAPYGPSPAVPPEGAQGQRPRDTRRRQSWPSEAPAPRPTRSDAPVVDHPDDSVRPAQPRRAADPAGMPHPARPDSPGSHVDPEHTPRTEHQWPGDDRRDDDRLWSANPAPDDHAHNWSLERLKKDILSSDDDETH